MRLAPHVGLHGVLRDCKACLDGWGGRQLALGVHGRPPKIASTTGVHSRRGSVFNEVCHDGRAWECHWDGPSTSCTACLLRVRRS